MYNSTYTNLKTNDIISLPPGKKEDLSSIELMCTPGSISI
jgi:hypothetical protein